LMSAASEANRYEQIMAAGSLRPGDLTARFARASRVARAAIETASEHETAIRDVAAGVAAPALVAFIIWIQEQARRRGLRRLRFLSRDGQVLYELTRRLSPLLSVDLDLEYVYCSRLTWSFAATRPAAEAVPTGHAGLRCVHGARCASRPACPSPCSAPVRGHSGGNPRRRGADRGDASPGPGLCGAA
jgi:hypothetical protein